MRKCSYGPALAFLALLVTHVMPPGAAAATPVGLEETIQAARTDAARRTGLAPESLELVSAETVSWPDGSLGCPHPGMLYTQALVAGFRIRLRAQATLLDYHASARGALVLCPAERSTDPAPDPRT